MQDVLSLILGGGRGRGLYPLTRHRSEPAVPLAGKYRLIDVPISNCINSGIHRIYVLTQFLSVSLHRHIANTYKGDPFSRRFIEVLAAQQTNEAADWWAGTANALRQNLHYIREHASRDVLVLSGDQLYRMDFRPLLRTHHDADADLTIAALPVTPQRTRRVGVLRVDETGRIAGLVEKPRTDADLAPLCAPAAWLEKQGVRGGERGYLANLGIYLFRRTVLEEFLSLQPSATDIVFEMLPAMLRARRAVVAHLFDGYWEDLGTISSYYNAHLALASSDPPFDFHSPEGVIYTRMRNLPASRIQAARAEQCLISDGCLVQPGTELHRSVLGVRSQVGRDVVMRGSIMIGADRYQAEVQNPRAGVPPLGVGDGCIIERAILDKDCRIGRGVKIVNRRGVQQEEKEHYVIRDGIVVIPNGTVVPDGTEI
jgi:glucose-1-phosphate adenylyltransferase